MNGIFIIRRSGVCRLRHRDRYTAATAPRQKQELEQSKRPWSRPSRRSARPWAGAAVASPREAAGK